MWHDFDFKKQQRDSLHTFECLFHEPVVLMALTNGCFMHNLFTLILKFINLWLCIEMIVVMQFLIVKSNILLFLESASSIGKSK